MILRAAFALLMFQVAASMVSDSPAPEARHFRYERTVSVPRTAEGQACAVLDAMVFAHAAKQSLDDVRLYAKGDREVPFTITESGSTRIDEEKAELRNLGLRGGNIVFDLRMPDRPYTAVQLDLNAQDFVATASVSGSNVVEAPVQLGEFALFDLRSQHLSRSTTLPLQESTFRDLHVVLHLASSPGAKDKHFAPAIVRGATVPPSREAQTLYTTVATTSAFLQSGRENVATIHVLAHVPVERFTFELDPSFHRDFLRDVSITARPDAAQDTSSIETISGAISHTTLPGGVSGFVAEGSLTQSSVDAVLGADLRQGATVAIAVQNGDDASLPIRAVQLQMRQRRICFQADPAVAAYTLRYGDDALKSPMYDYPRLFVATRNPVPAELGQEERNPLFQARRDMRPYSERHPEFLWVALVAAVAALGTIAMRSARGRH